jgi:hypothetical protein
MPTVLSNIRDNHARGTVADFLRAKIQDNSHQSARGFILPNEQEQVHEKIDLELVTWLVIKDNP